MDEMLDMLYTYADRAMDRSHRHIRDAEEYTLRCEALGDTSAQHTFENCRYHLSNLISSIAELHRHLTDIRDSRSYIPRQQPGCSFRHLPTFLDRTQALHIASNNCRSLLDCFVEHHQMFCSSSPTELPPDIGELNECVITLCASIDHFCNRAKEVCQLYDACEQEIASQSSLL